MLAAAVADPAEVLADLQTTVGGLTADDAGRRLLSDGPNVVTEHVRVGPLGLLGRAVANPLVVLLTLLAGAAVTGGDRTSAAVMLVMVTVGVGLRFVQESRAGRAAEALRDLVRVHATVLRDGVPQELPIERLVPGDIVQLAAGDMVPADVRLVTSKDLCVSQAVLSGESFPVEKHVMAEQAPGPPPLTRASVCWLGSNVESGTATAVVVATGRDTLLGSVAASLEPPESPTAFDIGMQRLTWLLVAFVAVLVPLVFILTLATKHDWATAAFFSLAVGVGLTPEMLPMIVAVCLARGALEMAKQRVIVKHLDSIQNLGAMDVLCTDKTGTLTLDRIILERHCDLLMREDPEVLRIGWLVSHFQTGLRSAMDRAVLEHEELRGRNPAADCSKLDEIPFDFTRRVMSVVVEETAGGPRLFCKGAPDAVHARCTAFEIDGVVRPIDHDVPRAVMREADALAAEGFRVLAVAYRAVEAKPAYARDDEHGLVLRGYLAFLDPPKDSARGALEALASGGVAVKVLTGDNEFVAAKICRDVGIRVEQPLVGDEVERMTDEALAAAATSATLMARLTPAQKERVVRLLRGRGHVVGFLGDGINDAPALRAADVGISVDTAVDIARESADCILLGKDLRVLEEGVRAGRKVFVNIIKYVRMGTSSAFGNMLSVLVASVALPFVPMTPLQILTTNLLYDCSQVPIPGDDVDPELVAAPRPWATGQIARFILCLGPVSSLFDVLTFAVLWFGFGGDEPARAAVFRTGWFVESLVTQTLVIHVIRTDRIPFIESRASVGLSAMTVTVIAIGIWLVHSPLAPAFGFAPLPAAYWPFLIVTAAAYLASAHLLKKKVPATKSGRSG
jgi:Mg2+-importing ATPase